MSSANIFSHSVGGLFVLLMVSFAVQKLFSLQKPRLFIFAFNALSWGDISKKKKKKKIAKTYVTELTAYVFF